MGINVKGQVAMQTYFSVTFTDCPRQQTNTTFFFSCFIRSSGLQSVFATPPSASLKQALSSRAVECDNGVCVLCIKRHYHTK